MAAGREIRVRIRGIQYPPRTSADMDGADRDETDRDSVCISSAAENPQSMETVQEVDASYFFRAGAHYLLYEEQPEGFEQVFKTRVKRREQRLEINRQGSMGGSMVFEPGKTYRTEYATPFGILLLDIVTETVEVIPGSDIGSWRNVKVRYTLENQGEDLGKYELYIESI